MLSRGRSNVTFLVQKSKQSVKTVKESLIKLLQHRLITYAEQAQGTRVITFYEINIHNVMLRDRFPLYIQIAISNFGEAVI